MNHGAGWIIFEESYHQDARKLLSILPARRTARDIAAFMQQLYIDRFASIHERLSYKKSPKSTPFQAMTDRYCGPIHIGHDPFFVGIYARKITLKRNLLEFQYRIAVNSEDPFNPKFEDRRQFLVVDV